jgi:hypothetical protein
MISEELLAAVVDVDLSTFQIAQLGNKKTKRPVLAQATDEQEINQHTKNVATNTYSRALTNSRIPKLTLPM